MAARVALVPWWATDAARARMAGPGVGGHKGPPHASLPLPPLQNRGLASSVETYWVYLFPDKIPERSALPCMIYFLIGDDSLPRGTG